MLPYNTEGRAQQSLHAGQPVLQHMHTSHAQYVALINMSLQLNEALTTLAPCDAWRTGRLGIKGGAKHSARFIYAARSSLTPTVTTHGAPTITTPRSLYFSSHHHQPASVADISPPSLPCQCCRVARFGKFGPPPAVALKNQQGRALAKHHHQSEQITACIACLHCHFEPYLHIYCT
jgi:hypothetical protein